MSGPMDPAVERVARALVKLDDHPGHEALLMSLRATLLAHDHWEAEAKDAAALLRAAREFAKTAVSEMQGQVDRALTLGERATEASSIAVAVAGRWEAEARKNRSKFLAAHESACELHRQLDDSKREAKRYRSRCPVTAEDVVAAGVTWAQCEAWLDIRLRRFDRGTRVDWKQQSTWVCTTGHGWDMAGAINNVAKHFGLDRWDILGEMAAMDTGAEVDQ